MLRSGARKRANRAQRLSRCPPHGPGCPRMPTPPLAPHGLTQGRPPDGLLVSGTGTRTQYPPDPNSASTPTRPPDLTRTQYRRPFSRPSRWVGGRPRRSGARPAVGGSGARPLRGFESSARSGAEGRPNVREGFPKVRRTPTRRVPPSSNSVLQDLRSNPTPGRGPSSGVPLGSPLTQTLDSKAFQ